MLTLPVFGGCALLSQMLSTWGSFAQIRLNQRRRSTEGLSFFYWESRVWSKLPWFAFVFSLRSVDWSLILSMAVAIVPPFIVLHQFRKYSLRSELSIGRRIEWQYFLLLIALLIALFARERSLELQTLLAALPVLCAIIALGGGGVAQYRLNRVRGNADAVAGERYFLLVASNLLWFWYGFDKGVHQGWSEAWTVCCCSGLGTAVYTLLAGQYFALKGFASLKNQKILSAPPAPANL